MKPIILKKKKGKKGGILGYSTIEIRAAVPMQLKKPERQNAYTSYIWYLCICDGEFTTIVDKYLDYSIEDYRTVKA